MFAKKWLFVPGFLILSLFGLFFISRPRPVWAGCGCDKLPPALAEVRPNVTYAGAQVALFHPELQTGQSYTVTFRSGTTEQSIDVHTTAMTTRDLADGIRKPQLVVAVPDLPLGPTALHVRPVGQPIDLMSLEDSAFTVAPKPLMLLEDVGQVSFSNYQAAVGRDGTVYFSLDVSNIHHPRTFQGQALGYPLHFTGEDVVFVNTQGFLMQLLDPDIRGLFTLDPATGDAASTGLRYARHEFNSFAFLHADKQVHEIDPQNPDWHIDGSPHIDHDHLIMAVSGLLSDGSVPTPGATPPFTLMLHIATFFQHGLFGNLSVGLSDQAGTDSYNSQTGQTGAEGDVFSNGHIVVEGQASIDGEVSVTTTDSLQLIDEETASGDVTEAPSAIVPLQVDVPDHLPQLGNVLVSGTDSLTLEPGSYQLSGLTVRDKGRLFIKNAAGPVTLYVSGAVDISGQPQITVATANPEAFTLYVAGTGAVRLSGSSVLTGVVYAPDSFIGMADQAELFGSFVGNSAWLTDQAQAHYDPSLQTD